MKCSICKFGETNKGTTTVVLKREQSIIIIKTVPADICNNCGEYYLSEKISTLILEMAENAILNHAEIEILTFAA